MFSILAARREGPSLVGARVLDLYAGTGALGLEALSRGAASAVFVEQDAAALAALRANVAALSVTDRTKILALPVGRAGTRIAPSDAPFDLVFIDPPYASIPTGELSRAIDAFALAGRLSPSATVVVEHASADEAPSLAELERRDSRRYGDTSVSFYLTKMEADGEERV